MLPLMVLHLLLRVSDLEAFTFPASDLVYYYAHFPTIAVVSTLSIYLHHVVAISYMEDPWNHGKCPSISGWDHLGIYFSNLKICGMTSKSRMTLVHTCYTILSISHGLVCSNVCSFQEKMYHSFVSLFLLPILDCSCTVHSAICCCWILPCESAILVSCTWANEADVTTSSSPSVMLLQLSLCW